MIKIPEWAPKIKFLCFDVDGTLCHSISKVWEAIKQSFVKSISGQLKISVSDAEKYISERYKILGSTTKVLEEAGIDGKEFFNNAYAKLDFSKIIKKDDRLIKLIAELKKRYLIGILSNGGRDAVIKKIQAVGLEEKMFNPFLTTYEMQSLKPDPAPFLKALEIAGCPPEESVYIGDSVETDIMGAKAVGMKTILVWGKSPEADLSIPAIYDLEKIFL
jgi:putative hydrolase of the HAD superfamily